VRILLPVSRVGDASTFRKLPKLEPNAPAPEPKKADDKDSVPNETKTP
jgi:hypothetical protein